MPGVIAEFSIPYLQLLNEKGELSADCPAYLQDFQLVKALYRSMVFTRLFDKKAIHLQRTGRIGTYPPVYGQEAIASAIGHALRPNDVFVPYYRDCAAQFQRGVRPSEILAYWGGDERGNRYQSCPKDLPISVPIASQCLLGAGVAFSMHYQGGDDVCLVSLGDGATSEGDFYEAINVSGVWNLPIVFVINNNQWAISVNIDKQTHCQSLAQKAIAAGFAGLVVDGNDVLALRDQIGQALDKARNKQGPTLIEARSYRLSDHTTADDAKRYQPQDQLAKAAALEPIARFKAFLTQTYQWDQAKEEALIQDCLQELDVEVEHYLQSQPQALSSVFDYHYANLPEYLIEQRAIAEEEASNA